MQLRKFLIAGVAALGVAVAATNVAQAERPDDGQFGTTAAALKGKKVAFLYLDTPFGREPMPVFEALKRLEGYDFQTFPFPVPGNDQSAAFAQIRAAFSRARRSSRAWPTAESFTLTSALLASPSRWRPSSSSR